VAEVAEAGLRLLCHHRSRCQLPERIGMKRGRRPQLAAAAAAVGGEVWLWILLGWPPVAAWLSVAEGRSQMKLETPQRPLPLEREEEEEEEEEEEGSLSRYLRPTVLHPPSSWVVIQGRPSVIYCFEPGCVKTMRQV
jgi:hypothetical protein